MRTFPQRPTLADVAAAANVSVVTVSRVVEGSDKVSPATADRVRAAMERIGYYGNAAASSLVSGKSTSIGVMSANTADFGYSMVTRGITRAARDAGKSVLISVIDGDDEASVRKSVATVASNAVAGVIVVDFDAVTHAVIRAIPPYLPVVSSSQPGEDVATENVYIDEFVGARLAVEHLIGLGHRSVFVLGPPDTQTIGRRAEGALAALHAARLPQYPVVRCDDWQPASGYAGTARLLAEYGAQVTAVFAANDEIALGAIRAVLDAGLRVPEDVSVVGFDDNPISAFSSPPLTTVHQDFDVLGELAFATLQALIEEREPPTPSALEPRLVVRETTAPPAEGRGPGR